MNEKLESISIEITKKCNFQCKFCYAGSNQDCPEETYVTDERIEHLIHEIKINNLTKVTITGGEPLYVHDLFLRMLEKLHNNNIVINLNTNISLMTDVIAQEILKYIGNEFYIFTSLLSADEKTCDNITGVDGSYKKIVKGIECCKRNGLKVSLNFTVSRDNVSDLDLIENFVNKYRIDRVSISRVIPPSYNRNSEKNILTAEEIKKIADILVDIHKKFHVPVTSSHPLPLCAIGDNEKYDIIESQMCRTGVRYCAVNLVTGNVFACSQENKSYGNIYSQSLYECWSRMKNEHGLLNLKQKCRTCYLLERCGGECRWSACTIC